MRAWDAQSSFTQAGERVARATMLLELRRRGHVDDPASDSQLTWATGFFFTDTLAITAAHNLVLHHSGTVVRAIYRERFISLEWVRGWSDPAADIAVLRLRSRPDGVYVESVPVAYLDPTLPKTERGRFWAGRQVVIFGYAVRGSEQEARRVDGLIDTQQPLVDTFVRVGPGGQRGEIVRSERLRVVGSRLAELRGLSGGPVFDLHLRCAVGVQTSYMPDDPDDPGAGDTRGTELARIVERYPELRRHFLPVSNVAGPSHSRAPRTTPVASEHEQGFTELVRNLTQHRGDVPPTALGSGALRLAARVMRHTMAEIDASRGAVYVPALYVELERPTTLLRRFLDDMPHVAGLLLAGESGTGKTALLYHTAEALVRQDLPPMLPLLVTGRSLSAALPTASGRVGHAGRSDRSLPPQPRFAGALGPLGKAVAEIAGYDLNQTHDWESLIHRLEADLQVGQSDRKLALLVDAVNEAPDGAHVLQEYDYVVHLARRTTWLRCVATVRRGSYAGLVAQFAERGVRWPHNEHAYVRETDARGALGIAADVDGFTESEAERAYARFQALAEVDDSSPACLTAFGDLPETVRRLARRPLLLRVLMEAFDRRPVSPTATIASLFARFSTQRLTPQQAAAAEALAGRCLAAQRPWLASDEPHLLGSADGARPGKEDASATAAALEQLVDLGVLVRTGERDYRFAHQLFLEYLRFRHFDAQELSTEEVVQEVLLAVEARPGDLEERTGALRLLVLQRVQSGESALLNHLIDQLATPTIYRFLVPLVFELRHLGADAYASIERLLLARGDPASLAAGADLYETVGDRATALVVAQARLGAERGESAVALARVRFAGLLLSLDDVWRAAKEFAAVAAWAKRRGDDALLLDAVLWQAYIHFMTGDCRQGLPAYDEGLALLERLRTREPSPLSEVAYWVRRSETLRGKGCIQHNMDANQACAASHEEALAIARAVGDLRGEIMSLINLADALWGCYRYGEALRMYHQALDLASASCHAEGTQYALFGRGMVWWSIGRHEAAVGSLQEGLKVARGLGSAWDAAYGLTYLSNAQASLGDHDGALLTNQEALALAQGVVAGYPLSLASFYHLWKLESRAPGAPEHWPQIEEALRRARANGHNGLTVQLTWLRLLHRIADRTVPDRTLERELRRLVRTFRSRPPIKGPGELLALEVVRGLAVHPRAIDAVELEILIDEVCERKAESLGSDDRQVFRRSRQCWGAYDR